MSRKPYVLVTDSVRKKLLSVHFFRQNRAHGFLANSTIPVPVDFPRSSTTTVHRSSCGECGTVSPHTGTSEMAHTSSLGGQ